MKNNTVRTERHLVKNIASYLEKKGYNIALEVPFLSRSIDIIYQTKSGELVAIEAKMDYCKRAFNQAKYCLLGASRVYVCLPERRIAGNIRQRFLDMGIGLIHADKPSNGRKHIKFVIKANRNENLDRRCKNLLREAFLKKTKGRSI